MKLLQAFRQDPHERGSFLSRIFGIFNEEVVRIWARDSRSPYSVTEFRPTLYDQSKRYTLDFLFVRDGKSYVSEMKCEIQYQNYKYWLLQDASQLDHHRSKRAFQLFLDLARDSSSVRVKAGTELRPDGAVLVWGATTPQGVGSVQDRFAISDVISVEECVADLLRWENSDYRELVSERMEWTNSLFQTLLGAGDRTDN